MIVVCPECKTSYSVPVETFTAEAKTLKCSHCLHSWLEEGYLSLSSDEELDAFSDSSFQDALNDIEAALDDEATQEGESVNDTNTVPYGDTEDDDDYAPRTPLNVEPPVDDYKPKEEPSSESKIVDDIIKNRDSLDSKKDDKEKLVSKKKKVSGGVVAGVFAAIVLFTTLFVVSLVLKDKIVSVFPATAPLYSAMGFNIPIEAEGLAFDRVKTEWEGALLSVKGNIINLLPTESPIPKIRLSFQSDSGEILDEVIFAVSEEHIKGENTVSFKYEVQAMASVKNNTSNVKIAFIAKD